VLCTVMSSPRRPKTHLACRVERGDVDVAIAATVSAIGRGAAGRRGSGSSGFGLGTADFDLEQLA